MIDGGVKVLVQPRILPSYREFHRYTLLSLWSACLKKNKWVWSFLKITSKLVALVCMSQEEPKYVCWVFCVKFFGYFQVLSLYIFKDWKKEVQKDSTGRRIFFDVLFLNPPPSVTLIFVVNKEALSFVLIECKTYFIDKFYFLTTDMHLKM